jgi:hypothetical protein
MLPSSLCIDLGSAYTKIGFRETPFSRSRLLSLNELSLDDQHVCIPSVAAWRERDDRWAFGIEAADIVAGSGIHVYRNWKADLFPDGPGAGNPWDLLGEDAHEGLRDGPGSYARARNVAARYLGWLRQELVPRMIPGQDLGKVVMRICIPEFAMFSPHAAEMDRMLEEAGWHHPASYCCSEPMSNLTGALTQGHNAVLEPQPGKLFADVPKMFERSHLLEMAAVCQENDEGDVPEYATLIVDVGAYTTDFGLISIDLAGHGFVPISKTKSVPLGIHELDRRVIEVLPEPMAGQARRFTGAEWERFHRVVYTEEREWTLPTGGAVNGGAAERARIRTVMDRFSGGIAAAMDAFLRLHRPTRVQEVILTGGGNNIPALTERLRMALAPWGVSTVYLPKAGAPLGDTRQVEIVPGVVRGASAVGGSSVLFDLA